MKKHYEDIHSLFQHDPPKIARNLFCKDFIDQSLRTEVTNVQNAMSNESKADMLINAIDKFFDTHTEPDKMLETLLDIFDKCGPLGRNITKKIRNECEYWCLIRLEITIVAIIIIIYVSSSFFKSILSLSLLFVTFLSLAYRLTLIYENCLIM